jgi:muramidase (phage lysozyme)
MLRNILLLFVLFGQVIPHLAGAEAVSILVARQFGGERMAPLIRTAIVRPATPSTGSAIPDVQVASLFVDRAETSFFARAPVPDITIRPGRADTAVDRLRSLIGQAESRKHGYDAVQHGAKRRPSKLPTQMTIAEIYDWIARTPGQPHAIGRYQFIPTTLKELVNELGISKGERFTPRLQDRLADLLLADAGLSQLRAGEITRHAFMNNLARIWAGLPNSSGKSHYHGYAGNKASMTWAYFDAQMSEIFPG